MRRISGLVLVVTVGLLGACGGWKRAGSNDAPPPSEGFTGLLDQQALFKKLGRLSAGDPLPFTGSVAQVKASGDTILVILGLSLENRALSFQKDKDGFVAHYRVDAAFQPATGRAVSGGQEETVRVDNFQETARADESILFQKFFRLRAGELSGHRDGARPAVGHAQQGGTATGGGTHWRGDHLGADPHLSGDRPGTTGPVPQDRAQSPRGSGVRRRYAARLSRGLQLPQAHCRPLPGAHRDRQRGLQRLPALPGGLPVESQFIKLRPDSMALGELRLVVGSAPEQKSVSAAVSFSSAWLVTNFDEMISMLRWFGHQQDVDRLKKAEPNDRAAAWLKFWKETDPNPDSPENEALNAYFGRVAVAAQQFHDEGMPGWRTDRGEVYIRIGPPDDVLDSNGLTTTRVIRWTYTPLRLTLYFRDDSGFNRFRLTPESRSEFERIASRQGN